MHLNILALAECKKQDIYTGILPSVFFLLAAYLFIGNSELHREKDLLFYSENGCNTETWARSKPGAMGYI